MTITVSPPKANLPAIALAAVASVVFWSLKPIFISIIGDRGDYAEVYIASGSIAVFVSLVVACVFWKQTLSLARSGKILFRAIGWSCISGLFLATWYYGYYRALYGAAKADATVIAFTWPLIATIAIRIFTPTTAERLKPAQWLLILASFIGAVAIGASNFGIGQSESDSPEILWAFVAALGSGLYLPFAFKATVQIEKSIKSKPLATFYTISIANGISLLAVLIALKIADHPLRFYAFDSQVFFVCALIGIGTYLIAEITWTWAFQAYKSLTLSSLPYFSPAASVILLHVFFDEPVRPIAIVGLVLILFSNLTLHANQKTTNALGLTLIATVYVALASQILPWESAGAIPELTAAITGLFAILAGFILSRASARRTEEIDARAILVRRFTSLDQSTDKVLADRLLCRLLEYEFSESKFEKRTHLADIQKTLSTADVKDEGRREEAKDALAAWLAIHDDRLSIGESAALWLTGLGSVIFVLLLRDASPFGTAGSVIFAAGAFLVIFTIHDYDRNNLHGFHNQVRRLQQGFVEIDKPYYVPAEVVEAGFVTPRTFDSHEKVRIGRSSSSGKQPLAIPKRTVFNSVYLSTAALVILAILVLPVSSFGGKSLTSTSSQRPGEIAAPGEKMINAESTIAIADPGWPAASTSARVISAVLTEAGVENSVEPIDQITASRELIAEDPKIHVHPDLWLQNQSLEFREAVESKHILLSNEQYSATQNIYILDSDETKKLVRSFDSLRNPHIAQLLDSDGDGNGEIWLGASGWVASQSLKSWLDESNLERIEGEIYSETIFKSKLDMLAARGKPAVFYGYVPDSIHSEFNLRTLAPVPNPSNTSSTSNDNGADVYVARSTEVAKLSSTADWILDEMSFTTSDMNRFIQEFNNGVDPAITAENWVEEHRKKVEEWIRPKT